MGDLTLDAMGELTVDKEPLSPAARLFHVPRLNCCIMCVMGFQTKINIIAFKQGLEHSVVKHPRFSSVVGMEEKKGKKMSWIRTRVDIEKHVFVPDVDPNMDSADEFVQDYLSDLSKTSLDPSKPLWDFHLLNVKTSEANAVGILRMHHSIGDGVSTMSLLLACARKTSDPTALPSVPKLKRAGSSHSGGFWASLLAIWSTFMMIFNTLVDVMSFSATTIFLKDTNTPLKGVPAGMNEPKPKRFIHRTVSLEDIKLVKNAMNMTINDVLLGITQAGLSRYLRRRYASNDQNEIGEDAKKKNNLPNQIRLRATLFVNKRPSAGVEALADMMEKSSKVKWGNSISYVLLPFIIASHDDPLNYVREAKATVDRKKNSLEALCMYHLSVAVLKLFGAKAAAYLSYKVLCNTTLTFSNVVGPQEEISLYGHPIAYLAPTVCGHTQAIALLYQSYANKMIISLAVDQDLIPDPHCLCHDLEDSLKLIKDSVMEKQLIKDSVV